MLIGESNYVSYANISSSFGSFLSAYSAFEEPKSYSELVKHKQWVEAMQSEIASLEDNNTWSIVDLPPI